jgi:hypothetical protein
MRNNRLLIKITECPKARTSWLGMFHSIWMYGDGQVVRSARSCLGTNQ